MAAKRRKKGEFDTPAMLCDVHKSKRECVDMYILLFRFAYGHAVAVDTDIAEAGRLSGLGQLDLELHLCVLGSVVLGETADEAKETATKEPTDFNASNLVIADDVLVLLDQGWVAAVGRVDHGWGVHHGLAVLDTRGAVGSAGGGHGHVGVAMGVVDDLLAGVGGTHGLLGHLLSRVTVGGCWGCGGRGGRVLLFRRHDGCLVGGRVE